VILRSNGSLGNSQGKPPNALRAKGEGEEKEEEEEEEKDMYNH
jgi:hypothetical protein